jgi:hypothetical protein
VDTMENPSTLDYVSWILQFAGTGKRKRTLHRLADEHMEFYRRMNNVPQPEKVPVDSETLNAKWLYAQQILLNHIAATELPAVYTGQLQQFLTKLGIAWPAEVFKVNLGTRGSGRTPSELGACAAALHQGGLGWGGVAKILIPQEYEKNRKKATNKVRLAAKPFIQGNPE